MIDITAWLDGFLKVLNDTFGNRVWFVGLQGSYGRGEAVEFGKMPEELFALAKKADRRIS